MLGYDRPLKPEWIYKSLRMVEPGRKPEEFYDAYNDIATELTGKDGRRKTRTVCSEPSFTVSGKQIHH